MSQYSRLPAELRQRILTMILPESADVDGQWREQLRSLILIDKTSYEDMKIVILSWSPVYTITCRMINGGWHLGHRHVAHESRPRSVLPTRLTYQFNLFGSGELDYFDRRNATGGADHYTFVAMLEDWEKALPDIALPPGTKTVIVDATPAPNHIRAKGSEWIASIVDDRRFRERFQSNKRHGIARLINKIPRYSSDVTDIVLVGTYSIHNRPWVEEVESQFHQAAVRFTVNVDFVQRPEASIASDWAFHNALYSPSVHAHRFSNSEYSTSMPYDVWERSTMDLYAELTASDEARPTAILHHLRDFVGDDRDVNIAFRTSKATESEMKFIQKAAEGLRLWIEETSEDPKLETHYLEICREPRAEPLTRRTVVLYEINSENMWASTEIEKFRDI